MTDSETLVKLRAELMGAAIVWEKMSQESYLAPGVAEMYAKHAQTLKDLVAESHWY